MDLSPIGHSPREFDPRRMHWLLCLADFARVFSRKRKNSHAGIWTRVAWVKARYPNQLDYMGHLKFTDSEAIDAAKNFADSVCFAGRQKKIPVPGFEPGSAGWEPAILTN